MKVEALKHEDPHPGHRQEFIDFVKQVCPDADVPSVMLFGQTLRTSHLLMQVAEKHLESVGLTWAKFRLLMNLLHAEKHGAAGMQPSELSERQDISRNTVSALISSLEKDGFISRELHATDRRKFIIRLTPKGRDALYAQLEDQFKFVAQCFDLFTAAERQVLLNQLMRLNASLHDKAKLYK